MRKTIYLFSCLTAGLLLSPPEVMAQQSTRFWVGAGEGGINAGELDTQTGQMKSVPTPMAIVIER